MQLVLFGSVLLSLVSSSNSQTVNPANGRSGDAACCIGNRGDVNGDGNDNTILDLNYMVTDIFRGGAASPCPVEADLNSDGAASAILDLNFLVNDIFRGGAAAGPCETGISDEERFTFLNAIDSVSTLLDGVSPDSLATALVAFLNGRSEYEEVGREGTSVWARFDDGRMVMIPNNRFPEDSVAAPEPRGYEPSEPTPPTEAVPLPPRRIHKTESEEQLGNGVSTNAPSYGLPHSVQAAVFGTLGPNCFEVAIGSLGVPLKNGGYWLPFVVYPGVNDLILNDYGFFYIESHGGVCESRNSIFITGIWTNTPYSVANDVVYKPQLDADELVYMYAKGGNTNPCSNQWRYAFTGKFVASYMTFAPNSFVYISACQSDAPSLRSGFQTAGASVYAGWTMPVTDRASNNAGEFLIDRMLGTNQSLLVPVESPKQRPFDHVQLLQDMTNRGLDIDPKNGSELRITELNPGFGLLAPSLRFAYVINFTDTLFLTGYFGEDPGSKGHVYVQGVEQTVYQWEPTFIWAGIPRVGAGSAGAITVEVEPLVGPSSNFGIKRKSNAINLTDWVGFFTYTKEEVGSLQGNILFLVHLRADVHSFREAPHIAPAPNPFIVFGGALDSDAHGTASGDFQYTYVNDPPPNETYTWTWSGSTPSIPCIPYEVGGEQNPYGTFLLQGSINAPAKYMELLVHGSLGGQMLMSETVVSSLQGLLLTNEIYLSPPFDLYDVFAFKVSVNLGTNWEIINEINSWSTCCSVDPDNDGSVNDVLHKLEWLTITPDFAPDPNAAQ